MAQSRLIRSLGRVQNVRQKVIKNVPRCLYSPIKNAVFVCFADVVGFLLFLLWRSFGGVCFGFRFVINSSSTSLPGRTGLRRADVHLTIQQAHYNCGGQCRKQAEPSHTHLFPDGVLHVLVVQFLPVDPLHVHLRPQVLTGRIPCLTA